MRSLGIKKSLKIGFLFDYSYSQKKNGVERIIYTFIFQTLVLYPRPHVITCTLRIWLREIGFALSYGALMLKTWRYFRSVLLLYLIDIAGWMLKLCSKQQSTLVHTSYVTKSILHTPCRLVYWKCRSESYYCASW